MNDEDDKELDFLVSVYEVCDELRDDSQEIDDKSEFIIRALSQQMANFYIENYPSEIDIEIEIMENTIYNLELEQDYELCAVYREAITLLKKHKGYE